MPGFAEAIRNAKMNKLVELLSAGSAAGKLRIYAGTRPATGGTATTLISEHVLSDPAAPAASGGSITLNAIASAFAVAAGTPSWARMVDSDGAFVGDYSVGVEGSGADLIIGSATVAVDDPVRIVSLTITDGDA